MRAPEPAQVDRAERLRAHVSLDGRRDGLACEDPGGVGRSAKAGGGFQVSTEVGGKPFSVSTRNGLENLLTDGPDLVT